MGASHFQMELANLAKCLLLGFMILWIQIHGNKGCFEAERSALLNFKKFVVSDGADVDHLLSSWVDDSMSDCCKWERVTCNSTTSHVIELFLNNTRQHDIDSESFYDDENIWFIKLSMFQQLKELRNLNLSYNYVIGCTSLKDFEGFCSIIYVGFERLSELKKLETLDLSYNHFNDSILPSLGALTSLKSLILSWNWMEGSFPSKGFERLEELDISGNLFNSSILSSFGALKSLKTLIVSDMFNTMVVAVPIQGFERLEDLDISYNWFNKSILSSLGARTSLRTLKIGWNHMEGSFPIQGFERLEELDISGNQFNSSILSSLGTLTSLKTLIVRGLCKFKSLVKLGLGGNQFSGPLPECIGNLTNLQVLDLSFNQLSGNFQSVVSKLTSLKYLLLSGNEFEGLFSFSALANHSKLELFLLSSGSSRLELETEHPTWFPTFQLKYIDLSNCNLNVRTRAIPSFLLYQNDILFIDLSHNMLFGTFPSWILRNNSKLQVMNLMNNSFTGTFHLPNYKRDLLKFDISSNNITGVLPKEFGLVLSNLQL
ncbi:hypothetical protein GH714_033816 [Hevea brasiliensis]|uniref:Leucine-rich repeat-containing N-terminal plant-type domain-containing protein n=1 Tax=Hevea brasiliensis TaxID=3981 RepID=A0A6A6NAH1_HEVBR|nr:hypothetical protein GH714_033816 [Hevea brasiliensis]